MPRQIIHTSGAPASPLYSQGVIAGSHLYVSGMVGVDPATEQLAGTDIVGQTRRALENCMAILAAGGAGIDDIVEVGILLADPADFAGFNEEWARWFTQDQPARYVAKLGVVLPDVLVSIRMTAHLVE
jgi:2-iminobutanoate/2-iminopropanoate deaminase